MCCKLLLQSERRMPESGCICTSFAKKNNICSTRLFHNVLLHLYTCTVVHSFFSPTSHVMRHECDEEEGSSSVNPLCYFS